MVPPRSDAISSPPWWLRGEEQCEVCLQPYVYEMEVRCPDCDGPRCPVCTCRTCGPEEKTAPKGDPGREAP